MKLQQNEISIQYELSWKNNKSNGTVRSDIVKNIWDIWNY